MTLNTLVEDGLAVRRADSEIDAARAARTATVRALQQLLEVLDGRRAAAHLQRWVATDVVEDIGALLKRRAPSPNSGEVGRLVRVHLQMHGPDRADYFGTLLRGSRVRAVAGRIETVLDPDDPHWMIVELTIL